MNFSSKKTLAALAICLSLLASACGNGGAANAPSGDSPAPVSAGAATTPAATTAETNAAEQTRTIQHAMGEAVIPAKPQRVVILTNEGTEALLALGVKPIAAVQSWYQEPWYEHIDAEMQDVTVLGDEFQPNLELIASLQPRDAFTGARESLVRCGELGLRVGVASASMNAREVIEKLGLMPLVDHIADPRTCAPKPSAEIYGVTCAALGATPARSICVEDAAPMIANLRAEGMYTVGIGDTQLGAHEQVAAIAEWDVAQTVAALKG